MENENNNYSFTPITEDNSVNEIKDDFFGGNIPEPNDTTNNEVPPILEVPEIKEEETSVASPAAESLASDAVIPENNVTAAPENINESVPTEPIQEEAPIASQPNIEPSEPTQESVPTTEPITENSEPITEVNAIAENVASEPVEVKIPEGLDEEPKEEATAPVTEPVAPSAEPVVNNPTPNVVPSEQPTPVVEATSESEPVVVSSEQPTPVNEPVNNLESQPEEPKKGRSIFDFFKTKEAPTTDNPNNETNTEESTESDPFNNFVVDVPESVESTEAQVVEPIIENNEPIVETPLPSVEETQPVAEETVEPPKIEKEEPEEVSLPNVNETISKPNFEPSISLSNNDDNEEKDVEPEPVEEREPIVKEVVVEKEKVVLGKKCPNCGEITAEPFCPNCGFLVE